MSRNFSLGNWQRCNEEAQQFEGCNIRWVHPSAKRKAFGLWIFRILKLRAQSFLKLITIISAIYPKIIFLFIAALSISISRQVSSLGVVTRGCHTTTHLRCNGEVLPETHGTLKILIKVRPPFVGSSIFTPKKSRNQTLAPW